MTLLLTLDDGSVQRALANAVEPARAAALAEAGAESVGEHVGVDREDAVSATHRFAATVPGYRGWHWSVTVATAGEGEPVTISEVVLSPGPDALVAPAWVPWDRRVRAGDLGVGDIFPTDSDDPRLAPAYLASDDPAIEETAVDAGLGRVHVLSRHGRLDAAERWRDGEFGPRSDMARSAPGVCGTCGFFVPLAGSLRAAFGVCGNEISPGDGHVVNVEYGCGAHSETQIEVSSSIPVAELVYDDSLLDMEPLPDEPAAEVPVAVGAGTGQESEAASGQPSPEATSSSGTASSAAEEPEAAAVPAESADEPEGAREDEPAEAIAPAEAFVAPNVAETTPAEAVDVTNAAPAGEVSEPEALSEQGAEPEDESEGDSAAAEEAPVSQQVAEPEQAEPEQAEAPEPAEAPGQASGFEQTSAAPEPGDD